MLKRSINRLIMGMLCLLGLAGCGGGEGNSQTNGQLTLSATSGAVTGGLFLVDAQATYVSPTGNSLGVPITITFTASTTDGTVLTTVSRKLDANSLGSVSSSFLVSQLNQVIIVNAVASTGGLSDQQILVIPSLAAMTSTPLAVGFPLDALAGATQTVTIAGGVAPYLAQIDSAHAADISVSVNGNSIVLTKLKNSVINGPAILATLTVSDDSGATPIVINVSYN